MLTIKVLGPGCPNCKRVEQIARLAVENIGVEAEFVKISEYPKIMEYNILSTPGLVVNEKVVCAGRIPTQAEVMSWIANALS